MGENRRRAHLHVVSARYERRGAPLRSLVPAPINISATCATYVAGPVVFPCCFEGAAARPISDMSAREAAVAAS